MSKQKNFDILKLVLYFLAVSVFVFIVRPNDIVSGVLYLLLPSLYLTFRNWKTHREALLFSFVVGGALGIYFQTISTYNNLWTYKIILHDFKIKDVFLDAVLWYVLWVWIVISIWSYFLDPHRHKFIVKSELQKHMKFFGLVSVLFGSFLVILIANHEFLILKNAYFLLGTPIIVLPIFYVAHYHRSLVPKLLKITLIMAIFYFIYEIVGLHTGAWSYGGQYLGMVSIFGTTFPIEEFALWIVLGTAFVVSLYEEFEYDLA